MKYFLVLLTLFFINSFIVAFRLQGVAVKGTLICNGIKPAHIHVAIYDVDRNPGDSDDLLDENYTDSHGRFALDGTTRELTTIEPELRIIHDCNDGLKPCHRLYIHKIPTDYIHHGKATKFYDIGMLDLSKPQDGEQRTCKD